MSTSKFFTLFILLSMTLLRGQISTDSLRSKAKLVVYDQPDETISIALKLLKSEKKVDEVAHLYMLISNAYIVKRNNDSSLYYILKASELINTDALPTTKIKILNSVAVQYQQMELYDKALETLDKSLKLTEKLPPKSKDQLFNIGFNYAVRGMIYRSQSNPDLALKKFQLAAENFQGLTPSKMSTANLSIINYNIGNCFNDLSQFTNALQYFAKAEKYSQIAKAKSLEAYALKGEGESLFLTQQYSASLDVLYRAEKMALSSDDLVLNEGIYNLLANNNLVLNNFEKFQYYNGKYLEVQKTLEQNELKSLNRYLNTQNLEEQKATTATNKQFLLYRMFTVLLVIAMIAIIIKKLFSLKKRNRRQRKLIETLTKAKKII